MKRTLAFGVCVACATLVSAGGRVIGSARTVSGAGMKEHFVYLQREGASGAWAGYTPDDGWYDFDRIAAGNYCLFDAGRHISHIVVPEGGAVRHELDHDADFWTSGGGEQWSHELGQTFVAIGKSITRLYIDMGNADRVYILTLHEGGRGGPQVGPTRTRHLTGTGPLVGYYLHNEMPVVPGQTYYVKVVSDIGAMLPVKCSEQNQYPYGQTYMDGVPQPDLDFRAEFNSERRGLIYNHPLLGSSYQGICANRITQSIIASGTSIVAVMSLMTYGDEPPPVGMEVSVWDGPPDTSGSEICPRKSIGGANDWLHGVGWLVGECPVTPGQEYYVRWKRRYLETWFIAMYSQGDRWPDGCLWAGDTPHADKDAGAHIIEHSGYDYIDMTEIRATDLGGGQVSVRWKTPVACSSQVRWEVASARAMSALDQADVTDHEVIVSAVPGSGTFSYSTRSWVSGRLESESDTYSLPLGAGGTEALALNEGWSLIGYASNDVPAPALAECRVSDGVQIHTWDDAVSAGWVQDGLFYYDGASYKLVKTSGGDSDSLSSGDGYWVLNESGGPLSLLLP